jgi:hypothetical protein
VKAHPRIRKTVKWGGTAVFQLLFFIGVTSVWIEMSYATIFPGTIQTRSWVYVGSGLLIVGQNDAPNSGLMMETDISSVTHDWRPRLRWSFGWNHRASGFTCLTVPIWSLLIAVAIPTTMAWRLESLAHRCARVDLCLNCNYDRRGLLAESPCPECGFLPAPSRAPNFASRGKS